jgi:hypothetical protein
MAPTELVESSTVPPGPSTSAKLSERPTSPLRLSLKPESASLTRAPTSPARERRPALIVLSSSALKRR